MQSDDHFISHFSERQHHSLHSSMASFCVAPNLPPPVVANAPLLSLILLIRHGTRTPTSHRAGWPAARGQWYCGTRYQYTITRTPIANGRPYNFAYNSSSPHPYGPACAAGYLLDQGFDQLSSFGAACRPYLTKTKIAPTEYTPKLLDVRSSWFPRAIESATAFLHGLYPPKEKGEIVTVTTGDQTSEPLAPVFDRDKEFIRQLPGILTSLPLNERLARIKTEFTPLFDYYNITTREDFDWFHIADLFFPYRCGNGELSEGVNDEDLEKTLGNLLAVEQIYAKVTRKDSVQPLNDFLLKEIEFLFGVGNPKLSLMSCHDVTFVTFLTGINYFGLKVPPPLASHLGIEVWEQNGKYVRVVLNGKVVPCMVWI
jgi:hypothetical protein